MNILFRVDSSSLIGTGHIMRDLVLASQYNNSHITFATQDLKGNINYKIKEAGYNNRILKSNDISEVVILINELKIDLIVIDHYKIDYKYEEELKRTTFIKILSFDDTYEKHYCDILLNHNISANINKYKNLVPLTCELRCGSQYTLIRDEFKKEKKKINFNKKIKRKKLKVFIAMGGADHSNKNIKILKSLKEFPNLKINIVTTKANMNLQVLKEYCSKQKRIKLLVNSDKIAKLMRKSDFAIITPSVTMNEVYFMNIPFIAIKTADNQKDMYSYLHKKNFLVLKKFDKATFKKNILKMINIIG